MFSLLPGTLSLELLEMIITKLLVRDKAKLLRLNKQWNAFMDGNAQVWKQLDLSDLVVSRPQKAPRLDGLDTISPDITRLIRSYSTKAKAGIYLLRTSGSLNCDWDSLLSHNWQYLTELEVGCIEGKIDSWRSLAQSLPDLKKLSIGGFITIDVAVLFLENSLKLEHASFRILESKFGELHCNGRISPKIRTLDIAFLPDIVTYEQRDFLKELIRSALQLEDLSIRGSHTLMIPDVQHLTKLRRFSMLDSHHRDLLLPPSLKMLSIGLDDFDETSVITPLPKLIDLAIRYNDETINMGGLSKVYKAVGPELDTLYISFDSSLEPDMYVAVIRCIGDSSSQISNVKNLEMVSDADDGLLRAIAATFPKLESLNIYGGECEVTRDGIKALVKSLPKLNSIDLALEEDLEGEVRTWFKNCNVTTFMRVS